MASPSLSLSSSDNMDPQDVQMEDLALEKDCVVSPTGLIRQNGALSSSHCGDIISLASQDVSLDSHAHLFTPVHDDDTSKESKKDVHGALRTLFLEEHKEHGFFLTSREPRAESTAQDHKRDLLSKL